MLGIGLRFIEPVEDDVPTDPREEHGESEESEDEEIVEVPPFFCGRRAYLTRCSG